MENIIAYLRISIKLGIMNVLKVLFYRIFIKSIFAKLYFSEQIVFKENQSFFSPLKKKHVKKYSDNKTIKFANEILDGQITYYCFNPTRVGSPPNWFIDPFENTHFKDFNKHWTKIENSNLVTGDIKNIWEPSRFNWLGTLVYAYKTTLSEKYIRTINFWLNDWIKQNPKNIGPNWICGQEASIRVMNLIIAFEIHGSEYVSEDLIDILKIHLDRIAPTTFYAKAQNNNHGISEGVALYLGGKLVFDHTQSTKYQAIHYKGLKLIENRIRSLILADGTFSQYSVVYHRMVLDMLSVLELIRGRWSLKLLSKEFYKNVKKALKWYESMIDPVSGGAPNFGGNDGTYLFNIDGKSYNDFTPSLLLASSIFNFPINPIFKNKHMLQIIFKKDQLYNKEKTSNCESFLEGGYLKLTRKNGMLIFRFPKYKFRASNCDGLHIDVWQDGINWVRDAGSFSYALDLNEQNQYSGTAGHSTIQFDNRNQMPRMSRFLFADSLELKLIEKDFSNFTMSSAYQDHKNNYHLRSIKKFDNGWIIDDTVKGVYKTATLRFLLCPGEWIQNNKEFRLGSTKIEINSSSDADFKLKNGFESLFYMQKTIIPIIEITFHNNNLLSSKITFSE